MHGWMLFSFDGRLNRKPYWIATIELTVAAIVVAGGVAAASWGRHRRRKSCCASPTPG